MCCILDREIPDVLPQSSELQSWSPSQWCRKWFEESWFAQQRQVKWKYRKLYIAHFLPKTRLRRNQARIQTMRKFWFGILRKKKGVDTNRKLSCVELYELKWHVLRIIRSTRVTSTFVWQNFHFCLQVLIPWSWEI